MRQPFLLFRPGLVLLLASLLLGSCGGGDGDSASGSDIVSTGSAQGVTPFIGTVQLRGRSLAVLSQVKFSIAPKAGATARAATATYSAAALARRGFLSTSAGTLAMPVFGLYAGRTNRVSLSLEFSDASVQKIELDITAAAYTDPSETYDRPTVLVRRQADAVLGFDYFVVKSGLGTPIVIDTDGEIRWVAKGIVNSAPSVYVNGGFFVGDQASTTFWRVELDGAVQAQSLQSTTYMQFHHNIDPGKQGPIAEVRATENGVLNFDTIAAEFSPTGAILKQFDFAAIISAYMRSQGDDPAPFIRPGEDWFHMNAMTYDPRDDSLIASGRENFLIKINYTTGAIQWILGDPTKYWYSFPSLRAKALTLVPDGLYPVGQHAVSVTSDGYVMIFNNGAASFHQPAGTSPGITRTYSAVSAYSIDPVARTAREVWNFDYDKTILSDICSSAYEGPGKSLLVSYAAAENRLAARLVGLDANRRVVFDFRYASPVPCNASWNAVPIAFEDLKIS